MKFHLVRAAASTSPVSISSALENQGQLVHERDVEIALGVFDHLGGLGDLDGGRAMNAGRHDRSVDVSDNIERLRILRRDHLHDRLEAVLLVAGIDALGRISDREIDAGLQARDLLEDRNAFFLDRAGIDRRFVDDDIALLERAADRARCRNHRAEIGPIARRRSGSAP